MLVQRRSADLIIICVLHQWLVRIMRVLGNNSSMFISSWRLAYRFSRLVGVVVQGFLALAPRQVLELVVHFLHLEHGFFLVGRVALRLRNEKDGDADDPADCADDANAVSPSSFQTKLSVYQS